MAKMIDEVLVVEVEIPWGRLSDWNEDQTKTMRDSLIKSCIKCANSITLTGIISDVGPKGYEKKNVKIEI